MKRRICECGRSIYGIGGLCQICLTVRRQQRDERPRKLPLIERIDQDRHPAHLAWIRSRACAVPGCQGRAEAAHVRMNTGGGMGLKPDDRWTIPLCGPAGHHAEQHQIGHRAFDEKYGINSRELAEKLAATSPYLEKEAAA